MLKLEVFDPPMCCPTGVCGSEVDPKLARFAGDLEWLKRSQVEVTRYNLAQQPKAFIDSPIVRLELTERGNACLPLILANGRILASGFYPGRPEFRSALASYGIEFEAAENEEECCNSDEECCDGEDCCESDDEDCCDDESKPGCCG